MFKKREIYRYFKYALLGSEDSSALKGGVLASRGGDVPKIFPLPKYECPLVTFPPTQPGGGENSIKHFIALSFLSFREFFPSRVGYKSYLETRADSEFGDFVARNSAWSALSGSYFAPARWSRHLVHLIHLDSDEFDGFEIEPDDMMQKRLAANTIEGGLEGLAHEVHNIGQWVQFATPDEIDSIEGFESILSKFADPLTFPDYDLLCSVESIRKILGLIENHCLSTRFDSKAAIDRVFFPDNLGEGDVEPAEEVRARQMYYQIWADKYVTAKLAHSHLRHYRELL